MTEEQFQRQETLRLKLEKRKQNLLKGKPMEGSVDEFLQLFKTAIDANPVLQEYIEREHAENKESIAVFKKQLIEQDSTISQLDNEVAMLRDSLAELKDNFNLFANKFLEIQKTHVVRVGQTCDRIDKELTL